MNIWTILPFLCLFVVDARETNNKTKSTILPSIVSESTNSDLRSDVIEKSSHHDSNYDKILDFWKYKRSNISFDGNSKEVVLVCGIDGPGKSAFISGLVGEDLNSTDLYGIEGDSTILAPEFFLDNKTKITFVDLPGFHINREIEYEIPTLYLKNLLITHLNRVKIIITVSYDSISYRDANNAFDDLFNRIIAFAPNISKFQNGIMMVVTNAKNQNRTIEVTKEVLNEVEDFLKAKVDANRNKENEKNEMKIKLMEYLLEKQNDTLKRVALFQEPNHEGSLSDFIKDEMDIVTKLLVENLNYISVTKSDFGLSPSKRLKTDLTRIIFDIFHNSLLQYNTNMIEQIQSHYSQLEEESYDIIASSERLMNAEKIFSAIGTNSLREYFENLISGVRALNLNVSQSIVQSIASDIQSLNFFIEISDYNITTEVASLESELKTFIDFVRNARDWNTFLIKFEEKLSQYVNQNEVIVNQVTNMTKSYIDMEQINLRDLDDLKMLATNLEFESYSNIETLSVNKNQLGKLWKILDNFSKKPNITCSSSQMIVQGYNIKMDDIIQNECWSIATDIQIFALNKIFIDCDVVKEGIKVQLSIFAPTWEMSGEHRISLKGKDGEPHELTTKCCGSSLNGEPGLPGHIGGHFLGVGEHFIFGNLLTIQSIGGNGGPGQNGAQGNGTLLGTEFKTEYTEIARSPDNFKTLLTSQGLRYKETTPGFSNSVWKYDIEENPGSDGGDGGMGGFGAPAGSINLVGFDNMPRTEELTGKAGLSGVGGRPSQIETNARKWHCIIEKSDESYKPPVCTSYNYIYPLNAQNGRDGVNKVDNLIPEHVLSNHTHAIDSFKQFVLINSAGTIKESKLIEFIDRLEQYSIIKSLYYAGYIGELENLELSYLRSEKSIDLFSSYESFRDRFTQYTIHDKSNENKIVQNYAYAEVFSKLNLLNKFNGAEINVNLKDHLDRIVKSFDEINEADYLKSVQSNRDNYKESLFKQIHSVHNFVTNKISPEINTFSNSVNENLEKLIEEINQMGNNTLSQRKNDLLEYQRNWQKTLIPLQLANDVLSLCGIPGALVSVGLINQTSTIEGLTSNGNLFSSIIRIYETKIMETTNVFKKANEVLKTAFTELPTTHISVDKINIKLRGFESVLDKLKNEKVHTIAGLELPSKRINQIRINMNKLINSEIRFQNRQTYDNMTTYEKVEKELQKLVNTRISLDEKTIVFNHTKEIKVYRDQIDNAVISTLFKIFYHLEQNVNSYTYLVNGSSHVHIDFLKWNASSLLTDAKCLLQNLIATMTQKMPKRIPHCFTKINEGFSIMIDLYNRIDSYSYIVKQVNYMEQINLANTDDHVNVTDGTLNVAIKNLRQIIKSNIFLEKYSEALHAMIQHYFPFAIHIFRKFNLKFKMEFDLISRRLYDIESIKSMTIKQIKNMQNFIDEETLTFQKKQFFDSNGSTPFYVWKSDKFGDDIQKLLNGTEITIMADILNGPNYNAIKYHDIGINFKFNNDMIQKEFDAVIKDFKLRMSPIGMNYYRCGERLYYTSIAGEAPIFNILSNNHNNTNIAINENHAPLSPYTLWSLKLTNETLNVQFDSLKKYENETIDLELVGEGLCIERTYEQRYYYEPQNYLVHKVCNGMLDQFYNLF